jgi:acetyltransferase
MRKQLRKLFQPKSVAVIGASDNPESIGYMVMKNLLEGGFKGQITPVNLRHREVFGQKSYYYIGDVPEAPELAVIATPDYAVLQVIRECGEAGVGALAILSGGFQESGREARHRLQRVKEIAREYGMRLLGPNCLGFINPHLGLNASFATGMATPGNIAFISQSGALGISTLDWAVEQNVGFSYFVSVGAMADVGYADLIDFFGTDHRTTCILLYMESLTEARQFMSAARAFARYKPIIVLKAGRSQEGRQAALSHTGALAGNDEVFSAAFRRSGIIRVNTIAQLFNCAQSLAMQSAPAGNRLAILSNAGGPGVLATDYLMANGGQLAELTEQTYDKLNEILPINWSHSNPVNMLGTANADLYKQALLNLLKDANTDAVLVILTYQSMTEPEAVAKAVVEVNKKSRKPLFAAWMGERGVQEARDILERGKVPPYRYPESAVDTFLKMYAYHRNLQLLYETPPEEPQQFTYDKLRATNIIAAVRAEGRLQMMEHEAKDLLACYDLPVTHYQMAETAEEAAACAKSCGYPVAMKVASPTLYHKTDVGGVRLNLRNGNAVRKAFDEITNQVKAAAPNAAIEGVIIERMVSKPFELFIGGRKDEVLGPVIAFGRGGVEVEVYRDAQLGLPPLNMALAHRIIERTQIYPLLKGYRGLDGVDLELLAFTLCKFAYLLMDFPEIRELDVNPFVMDETEGVMLDAHVVLEPVQATKSNKAYQHLVLPPYPGRYKKVIKAKDGTPVRLRPIRPEDEPMELEMVNRLSKESLYFRFFGYVPRMTHELMTRFTQIDYDREMAIVALIDKSDEEEEMIGVVRIIADPWGEAAEYAILVADEWQGKGLGGQMTDYIIEIAKDMELQRLYASVLASNAGMLTLFERKGFTIEREDFDTFKVELTLA